MWFSQGIKRTQEDAMPYQMMSSGTYPGTDLPAFQVFDAEEYNDTSKRPQPIGEVWGVGVKGVTGRFILTGFRWGLAGEDMLAQARRADATEPLASSGDAARAMIAAYEAEA
jgi:hypothetical protein